MQYEPLGMRNIMFWRKLYGSAFPRQERKPLWKLLSMRRSGSAELFAVRGEDGRLCGLAATVLFDRLVLIDYLAVAPEQRGGGIGSEMLRFIRERYSDRTVCLEIEDPERPGDGHAERERRLRFYEKNGFSRQDLKVFVGGVHYELLTSGSPVSFETYTQLLKFILGRFYPMLRVRRE